MDLARVEINVNVEGAYRVTQREFIQFISENRAETLTIAINQLTASWGTPDALVYNVGVTPPDPKDA